MNTYEHLHNRLSLVELNINRAMDAPTVPVFDFYNNDIGQPDEDFNTGLIYIGTNQGSDGVNNTIPGLFWRGAGYFFYDYFDSFLHVVIGRQAFGNPPQDAVEGQIVIGSDHSLNWFAQGKWYGKGGHHVDTVYVTFPPQDNVQGQLATGANGLFWFDEGNWYGFQPDFSSRAFPF